MRRRRSIKIGILKFNRKSVTAKVGPISINSRGIISLRKGPISLSIRIHRALIGGFLIVTFIKYISMLFV